MAQTLNREEWLTLATEGLRPLFAEHGYEVPANVRVTCGFPHKGGVAARKRTIGQCWDAESSEGKVFEVFISPLLDETIAVLATLAHELVHATVGLKAGHKAPFKRCAYAIGLEGKATATVAGQKFLDWIAQHFTGFPRYPHQRLNALALGRKQSTRLVKVGCSECGYVCRVTRAWLDGPGAPICPTCNEQMEEQ